MVPSNANGQIEGNGLCCYTKNEVGTGSAYRKI